MSSTDILQDVHDSGQMPRVNKLRLSLAHIAACVCVGYTGFMIMAAIAEPMYYKLGKAGESNIDSAEYDHLIDQLLILNLFIQLAGPVFIILGGIISFIICRKNKVRPIVPISIFLYSEILYWICEKTQLCGFLFPGGYLRRFFNFNYAVYINLVFVLIIALIMFFSKRIKNWWLKPVVE